MEPAFFTFTVTTPLDLTQENDRVSDPQEALDLAQTRKDAPYLRIYSRWTPDSGIKEMTAEADYCPARKGEINNLPAAFLGSAFSSR